MSDEDTRRELEEAEQWGRSLRPGPQTKRGAEHLRAKQAAAKKKKAISVRLDEDVLEGLKQMAGPDGSYQHLMNQALRQWLAGQQLEHVLRRVVREELEASSKKSA